MEKINSWHPDYAAESLVRYERSGNRDMFYVTWIASTFEVLTLIRAIAADLGDKKLSGIAETVAAIEAQRKSEGIRCRRKVTAKQRHVLAVAVLEKFGTARGVVKAAWGLSDEQIDSAEA